jgi:hypothetical protein
MQFVLKVVKNDNSWLYKGMFKSILKISYENSLCERAAKWNHVHCKQKCQMASKLPEK